ncbi:MAG: hypothetical protein AAGA65_13410 [Actinomycetota bacterium]
MAATDDLPPVPAHRDPRSRATDRVPRVGEQHRPYNDGELGYTYTIYRFYDGADRLLFLGESGRVRQRIVDLEIGNPKGLPLGHDDGPKPWWREAVRIELQHLPPGTTDSEAKAEEARQIELERPVYNRRADGHFDRARQDQVLDHAHFETEVATVEHERHEGLVRDLTQIEIESRRAADQLKPGGSALLDALPRRGPARPRRTWSQQVGGDGAATRPLPGQGVGGGQAPILDDATVAMTDLEQSTANLARRRSEAPTFYPVQQRGNGPGSRLGLAIVAVVLAATVVVALVVSLQAAF